MPRQGRDGLANEADATAPKSRRHDLCGGNLPFPWVATGNLGHAYDAYEWLVRDQ